MTPERQKWWDSLPANEKELRESLKIHRNLLSFNKAELTKNKDSGYISKWVRREKVLIKAIRHELALGMLWKEIEVAKANAKFVGFYETHEGDKIFPEILECERCGEKFLELYGLYEYCPRCGCLIDPY